jgi:hypothetical protein
MDINIETRNTNFLLDEITQVNMLVDIFYAIVSIKGKVEEIVESGL